MSGRVGAVLLAAGGSTRMGEPKQLLELDGRPLVRRAADAALAAGCRPVVVVVGAHGAVVREALAGLPVAIAENARWREGMAGSIRVGVDALEASDAPPGAAVLLLCDQPRVDTGLIGRLLEARRASGRPIAACAYAGTVGAPAVFDRALFRELRALEGDRGARALLAAHPADVAPVPFEGGAVDLDTPEELAAERARSTAGGGIRLGITLRNMGPQATRETLDACARAAEAAGLDSIWLADHVAIPPDDAEGSEGRYLDPLAALAFLAGRTERIGLGVGVLVLPYRPALPTAKWVATIQELSAGRLLLGAGVGWMRAEFRALGVPRRERGARSDAVLDLLGRCFEGDVVEENGQPFLFRPRPARPPIFVGGAPPHALERAVRYGDGWMPLAADPARLRPAIARLHELAEAAGRPTPEVVALAPLDLDDPARGAAQVRALAGAGVTRVVHATGRYRDAGAFRASVETLASRVRPGAT